MQNELRPEIIGTYRDVMPSHLIDDALRAINVDLFLQGIGKREIEWWQDSANWFPHIKWRDEIRALENALPTFLRVGELCDPQILLQFPHPPGFTEPLTTFHVDSPPEWANGRNYVRIVAVPLTPWNGANGGIRFDIGGQLIAPELNRGDVLWFRHDAPHTGGVNHAGDIRYGVYFRYLENE
jgi:hypothetical protein